MRNNVGANKYLHHISTSLTIFYFYRMFSADDATDSSSDDVPISHLKQVLDNSFNTENVLAPWSQIADQFKCLTINFQFPETVQFLESLLTLVFFCRTHKCIGKH